MNKIKLLIIILTTVLISCKTKTDSNKNSQSPDDLNSELKKLSRDSVTFYRNFQLDSLVNTLIKNDTNGTALGRSQDSISHYLVLVRTEPGSVEIHEQLDDIAIMRSGHGTLKTGYQVTGNIRTTGEEPWRNWFCDAIQDAKEQKLSPGDFIIIPAMTAHQYIPDPGDTLTYWTIKVKRSKKVTKL